MVDATITLAHLLAAGVPLNSQRGVSLCSLSLGRIVGFVYLFICLFVYLLIYLFLYLKEESTLSTKVSPTDEQAAICCRV